MPALAASPDFAIAADGSPFLISPASQLGSSARLMSRRNS
jgi:hypothetical protein